MNCPKCGMAIVGDVPECPHCGVIYAKANSTGRKPPGSARIERPKPAQRGQDMSALTALKHLFDPSMKTLITPEIITGAYAVGLVLGLLATGITMIVCFSGGKPLYALIPPVVYVAFLMFTRIQAEFLIVFFRVEENTRQKTE